MSRAIYKTATASLHCRLASSVVAEMNLSLRLLIASKIVSTSFRGIALRPRFNGGLASILNDAFHF